MISVFYIYLPIYYTGRDRIPANSWWSKKEALTEEEREDVAQLDLIALNR